MLRRARAVRGVALGGLALTLGAGVPYARALQQEEESREKPRQGMQGTMGEMGGMMSMMRAMMQSCPMMQGMESAPQMLLMRRKELSLSDDQVKRLRELRTRAMVERMAAMDRMTDAGRKLRTVIASRGSEAALKEAARELGAAHEAMALAAGTSRLEALKLLSPEQREKAKSMVEGMGDMGGMMRMMDGMGPMGSGMGGMERCPLTESPAGR